MLNLINFIKSEFPKCIYLCFFIIDNNEEDSGLRNPSNKGSNLKSSPTQSIKFTPVPPIQDMSECYPMNTNPRGLFILVNNIKFSNGDTRKGTEVDGKSMMDLFDWLGYEVKSHENKSADEMMKIFEEASSMSYSEYSALAICILSHGKKGFVSGTKGSVSIKEITKHFKKDNLAGKPKMFFIQACRGKCLTSSFLLLNGFDVGCELGMAYLVHLVLFNSKVKGITALLLIKCSEIAFPNILLVT